MHAGVPFVGVFTIVASGPGARPDYVPDIRVSQRPNIDFELQPGDGSRPTLDQVKAASAGTKVAGTRQRRRPPRARRIRPSARSWSARTRR